MFGQGCLSVMGQTRLSIITRSCKHHVSERGAHHENGSAECSVQELDNMMLASIIVSHREYQCQSGAL